jgi:hypothetical protein
MKKMKKKMEKKMQKRFFVEKMKKKKKNKKSKNKTSHFRSKGPTRANIAQLPVAYAPTKGAPKGSSDLCSLSVALVLVLLYYIV